MIDPPDAQPPRTAGEQACATIREKILSGELKPGTKLTRRGMAELAGFSVIPVIEAMHRLESEGLVESTPLIGSRVVTLDDERTRDRLAMREAVECQVARMLCGTLTDEQEAEFRELAKILDENLYTDDTEMDEQELWQLHFRFHSGLAALTQCPSLEQALHRVNLYDILLGVVSRNRTVDLPPDWHGRLVDALMSSDPDTAERTMREHVRSSLDIELDEQAGA